MLFVLNEIHWLQMSHTSGDSMAPKKMTGSASSGYPAVDDVTAQLANVSLATPQETNLLTPANVHT